MRTGLLDMRDWKYEGRIKRRPVNAYVDSEPDTKWFLFDKTIPECANTTVDIMSRNEVLMLNLVNLAKNIVLKRVIKWICLGS